MAVKVACVHIILRFIAPFQLHSAWECTRSLQPEKQLSLLIIERNNSVFSVSLKEYIILDKIVQSLLQYIEP